MAAELAAGTATAAVGDVGTDSACIAAAADLVASKLLTSGMKDPHDGYRG